MASMFTLEAARRVLRLIATGYVGGSNSVEQAVENRVKTDAVVLEQRAAAEVSAISRKPFKRYSEVDSFEEQFAPGVSLARRKPLILDGNTGLGKTAFAVSLVGKERYCEVNCSSVQDVLPVEGNYSPVQHDLLNFEDLSPALMIRNKRFFQGPAARVALGTMRRGRVVYKPFAFRKRFVICSNHWKRDLKKLPKEDKKWIAKNTIYLKVTSPMFEE